MKNVLVTAALLVLGWGIKFGWNLVTAEPYVEPSASEYAAETDGWVEESLADGTAAPALGWLDEPGHGTFEAHPPTMQAIIDRFHEAGAEEVWMVDIVEFGGKQLSDTVAVELPPAGSTRDALFAIDAEESAKWGGDGTEDVGQRFLAFSFD